ncbi:STAS/SEC14 domain-containing protein [Mucilaginibacter sp. UR6-1]|uniref:STAS/SEC14 domain-containing protein n=1 Tax=Mucilaginibacter sp. UR6-1 TaxID=1435643 RepID=UPI001E3DCC28|nr:STAS/SEC14 domain-containing protein [Mucilaginibacter sp. UR6-1]MCC8407631.1 STAS/SEC14 domain-containing protein [Mucilaginibacter sp. UR6-1]
MLRQIEELPAHVLGVHAVGKITNKDIKSVLEPAVSHLFKAYGELNYILVAESSIWDFTTGAMFAYFFLILKYYSKWNKVAVVADDRGINSFTTVFRFLIPGVSKRFGFSDMDKAIQWIAKRDTKLNTYDN